MKYVWLAVLGTLGVWARYWIGGWVGQHGGFPLGTLVINVSGCFLFGFIWILAEERFLLSSETRMILLIGFMGAFTTFSSFAFETGQLLREREWMLAGANIVLSNLLGLLFLGLGMGLARVRL